MIEKGYRRAFIVLARYPRPGRTKSRLAATMGNENAAEAARLFAERLFTESRQLPAGVRRYLFVADPEDMALARRWAGDDFLVRPQASGNFGRRLAESLRTAFSEGAQKAVVVGSDIPDLSASLVEKAYRLLDYYPLVIGPDKGGGYYLLGMKMLYVDLFLRNLSWGSDRVLGETLDVMQLLGLVPAFLPPLIDLDTEGDARRWLQQQGPGGRRDPLVAFLQQRLDE